MRGFCESEVLRQVGGMVSGSYSLGNDKTRKFGPVYRFILS